MQDQIQMFDKYDWIDFSDSTIVYQGVEGAYSQQAMFKFFGRDCHSVHVGTFLEAMQMVSEGKADYAVLPIENSTAGIVTDNYDLLSSYDNYIIAETRIPIAHCLLGLPGTRMEDIKAVYSHPQALMQCSDYLDGHEWERISFKNTAMAAQKVKEDGRNDQAAIASRITAELYGLEILDHSIQDVKNNTTRFLIISRKPIRQSSSGHVSICVEVKNESGSLYKMISHFYLMDLNMISLQARPIPEKSWQYRFFIDFEGSLDELNVQKALRRIEEDSLKLKILGTY